METPRLFGRTRARAELDAAIADPALRWVSVVGLGGVGKSALVLDWLERHPSADHTLCRLDHTGAASLPLALASALGARVSEATLESLGVALADAPPTLLILDGAEVLSADEMLQLGEWCASLESMRVVATSRWPLRVEGERVLRLEPLELPEAGDDAERSPAVAMLLERMARLGAGEPELDAVVDLARALGGLPLGLELCARTAALLGPAETLARLGDVVALEDPKREPEHRQASLQRVLDTTLEESPEWVRQGLGQATIFQTAFSLAAAEAVITLPRGRSVLALVHELVDRALVQVDRGAERRFRLHDLVRHAASARRADDVALRERHEAHFLEGFADECLQNAFTDVSSRRRLLLESPDLLHACARVREDPDAEPKRLARVAIVARAFFLAGIRLPALDALVERVTRTETLHALGPAGASSIAELVGTLRSWERSDDAGEWLERAVRLAEDSGKPELRFGALMRQAHAHLALGQAREAKSTVDAMRALLSELSEPKWRAWVLALGALAERHRAEVPWLEAQLREASRILGEVDAPDASLAWTRVRLADLLVDAGRADDGLREARGAARLSAANPQLRSYVRLIEALAHTGRSDFERAEAEVLAIEESAAIDESIRRLSIVARASLRLRREQWAQAMVDFETLNQLPVESGHEASAAVVHLGLAVAAAHAGAPERARQALAEAGSRIADRDPRGPFAGVLDRGHALLDGRALAARPAIRPTLLPTVAAVLRLVAEAAEAGAGPSMQVGPEALWVRVASADALSMTRRPVLQRLLWALVELHRAGAATLTTDELFEHGWPGETIDVGAARNRARVALTRLRKLGLDAVIERLPEGVRIRPAVRVELVDAHRPPN
ncbi:MAG: hypothetical protein JJ863_34210 [Deltaproteobacteria bacterium]|nr:hypothetical protein [Deltaproteobacteria bacterium]